MDLEALSDFHLVARHLGLGKAARASGRAKATLARHLSELEQSLGVRLFDRGDRMLRLTDEGRLLYERTLGPLQDIAEARELVVEGRSEPRGPLRVSAPVLLSHVFLGRLAARFVEQYPEVRLEITAEDRTVNLVEDGYDVLIRVNPRPDADLVGRCFGRDEMLIVASPACTQPDATSDDVVSAPAVTLTTLPPDATWRCVNAQGALTIKPAPKVRVSSLLIARDATRAGAGVSQLPLSMVRDDVESGRLVIWGRVPDRAVELWVLHSSRRLVSSKVARFVDFLCGAFPNRTLV